MCEFDNATIEMKKYYDFRTEVRKLYANDVNQCGDLCCKVLEIRDKYRAVESISIDITSFYINAVLAENTPENKILEIISKIGQAIGYFIVMNRNSLDPKINNDSDFETFINAPNFIFCDIIRIGNTITFTL